MAKNFGQSTGEYFQEPSFSEIFWEISFKRETYTKVIEVSALGASINDVPRFLIIFDLPT